MCVSVCVCVREREKEREREREMVRSVKRITVLCGVPDEYVSDVMA